MASKSSSDIEIRAVRTFRMELPDECIENEEGQDKQHLDYTLHLREDSAPSGIQFAAQVKGVGKAARGRRISRRFKRQHLEYWIDRSRLPVFIIIVDVVNGAAYYQLAREWARSAGTQWRELATTTVHIPTANRVSNHGEFIEAIRRADLETQQSAGQWAIQRLAQIDGRFAYDITNTDSGKQVVEIHAKERATVNLKATGNEAISKLVAMQRTGRPQEFQPGDIEFDGGPLFDHMRAEIGDQPFKFQTVATRDCFVTLLTDDQSGHRCRALEGLVGRIEAGTERVEYDTSLRSGVARVHGYMEKADTPAGYRGDFNLTVNVNTWVGQQLSELRDFDRISQLIDALSRGRAAHLQFTFDGIPIEPPIELRVDLISALHKHLTDSLDLVVGMREVAAKLEVDPPFPSLAELSAEAYEELSILVGVCRNQIVATNLESTETQATFTPTDQADLPTREQLRDARLVITAPTPAQLFGVQSANFYLVREAGPFTVDDTAMRGIEAGTKTVVTLRSAPEAKTEYRLATAEELRASPRRSTESDTDP